MIHVIWCVMILIAVVFSILNGTVSETLNAISEGAKSAVNLCVLMAGTMAFWMGITRISEYCGITRAILKLLLPLLKRLFPHYAEKPKAMEKISTNITANMLGLGNAATPLGIRAIQEMDPNTSSYPNASVILFVVINTASLQIIPTNVAALRNAYGSSEPFAVMPYIWITSICSLIASILVCKLCERMRKWEK